MHVFTRDCKSLVWLQFPASVVNAHLSVFLDATWKRFGILELRILQVNPCDFEIVFFLIGRFWNERWKPRTSMISQLEMKLQFESMGAKTVKKSSSSNGNHRMYLEQLQLFFNELMVLKRNSIEMHLISVAFRNSGQFLSLCQAPSCPAPRLQPNPAPLFPQAASLPCYIGEETDISTKDYRFSG